MKFNCECCGYATQNKSNFQRHTRTKKHQRNIGLCVENLHEHYSTRDDCQDAEYFKDEEISRMVFVTWNGYDDRLQEMMDIEEQPVNEGVKRNCMWVEKLKEKAKWKRGDTIYFYNKSKAEGLFMIHIKNYCLGLYFINEDGLLMVRNFDDVTGYRDMSYFVECDCVYNDNVRYELEVEDNGGFIMK